MTEVVEAWPATGRRSPDANLPRQPVEDASDLARIQMGTRSGTKERGLRVSREQTITVRGVFGERLCRCRMQRNEPGLAELGAADREAFLCPVDIATLQIEGFTDAQASDCQQAQQTRIGGRLKLEMSWHAVGRLQQPFDLGAGIQVRRCVLRPERQEPFRRHLSGAGNRIPVLRKPTDSAEPSGPFGPLQVLRLGRPSQREPGCDPRFSATFQPRDEFADKAAGAFQLEPEASP